MRSDIQIRSYEKSDREQCRVLWRELTEWHRKIYHDPSIGGEHPEDYFDKHLAQVGPSQLWVAVNKSSVVGLVGLILKEEEAQIEPLVVSRLHRGKGLGKKLIDKVISEAQARGSKLLSVNPVARNVEAIRLFYKLGFRNLGFVEMFMDFSGRQWKPGPSIFRCKFNY
jgi:ribosomal protein S18 acetylase RimI-like enzyme